MRIYEICFPLLPYFPWTALHSHCIQPRGAACPQSIIRCSLCSYSCPAGSCCTLLDASTWASNVESCWSSMVLHGPMPITHQMPKISRIALQTAKLLIVLFGKSVPCHLCKKSDWKMLRRIKWIFPPTGSRKVVNAVGASWCPFINGFKGIALLRGDFPAAETGSLRYPSAKGQVVAIIKADRVG